MQRDIALKLLNDAMSDSGLNEEESHKLFLKLETLAEYKYNSYEMFRPGRLFLENLYVWLSQFNKSEKRVALEFALEQIVFVSRKEMHQLAARLYNDIVRTTLRDSVAKILSIPPYKVNTIVSSEEFKILHRATLFLAMSDGARVDYFRRQNMEIVNEQIVPYYLVSRGKWQKMQDDLAHDISDRSARFKYVFLLDDFCGSGRTFIREQAEIEFDEIDSLPDIPLHLQAVVQFDRPKRKMLLKSEGLPEAGVQEMIRNLSDSSKYRAAIEKLLTLKRNNDVTYVGSFEKLMMEEDFRKILDPGAKIFYSPLLMTEFARRRLDTLITRQAGISKIGDLVVRPACTIPDSIRISKDSAPISTLCENYYRQNMGDEHTGDVKYGYIGCGLPLVMHHNTPNNSIFLLWQGREESFEPLFIRYERHGREMI